MCLFLSFFVLVLTFLFVAVVVVVAVVGMVMVIVFCGNDRGGRDGHGHRCCGNDCGGRDGHGRHFRRRRRRNIQYCCY